MFQSSCNILSSTMRQYLGRGCHRSTGTLFKKQSNHVLNSHSATSRTCSSHSGSDHTTSLEMDIVEEPARPIPFRIPKAIADHLRALDEPIPAGSDRTESCSSAAINTRSRQRDNPRLYFEHSKESGLPFETLVEDNNSYREYISRVDLKEKNSSLVVDKSPYESSTYQDDDLEYDISALVSSNDLAVMKPILPSKSNSSVTRHDDGWEPPLPSEIRSENERALCNRIRKLDSIEDLLAIYENHKPEFTFSHYNSLTMRVGDLIFEGKCCVADFKSDPRFLELCNELVENARHYDASMLLSLLRLITRLNLPANSRLSCTTLQMLRKQLNILNVQQLLYLDLLRSQLPHSQLRSALCMAIPIVLSFRLGSDVPDSLSLVQIVRGIFVSLRGQYTKQAEKFMMALYAKDEEFPANNQQVLLSLITSLVEIKKNWEKKSSSSSQKKESEQLRVARDVLLKEALQRSALSMNAFSDRMVGLLIQRLAFAFSKGDSCTYSQALLTAFADRVVKEDWPFQAMAEATHWLLKMNQTDETMLERLVTKTLDMPGDELRSTKCFVMPIIHALASSHVLARRSQHERQALLEKLLSHPSIYHLDQQSRDLPLTRLGMDLAAIGYFEPRVLQDVWQRTNALLAPLISTVCSGDIFTIAQIQAMKPLEKINLLQYMKMWQLQQLVCPAMTGESVAPEMLRVFELLSQSHCLNINERSSSGDGWSAMTLQLLQQVLKRQPHDALVAGVYTKHFVSIDFVLVLHADGHLVPQPVAVKSAATNGWVSMDSIIVPHNAKVLGLRMVGKRMMLNSCTNLRSQMKVELKLQEAEGVTPVLLLMSSLALDSRTEEERVLYTATALQQHGIFV